MEEEPIMQKFGTEKYLGTALKIFEGIVNRRAWEAFCFPIHPKHQSNRDYMMVDKGLSVFAIELSVL